MILLLEGLNRTGKSTLARAISRDLGWPIIKFNVPPGDAFPYFESKIKEAIELHPHFILDRCHLSNLAYNGLLGGGVTTPEQAVHIDRLIASQDAWLMLMVDSPFAIEARLRQDDPRKDGAHALTRSQIDSIQTDFERMLHFSEIKRKATYSLSLYFDSANNPKDEYYNLLVRLRELSE